jgi:Protein of unknown function (DUF3168)
MSAFAIVSRLLTKDAAVQALTKKIYPIEAPQGATTPFIVVGVASDIDELLLQGAGEYQRTRVSVESCSATSTEAISIDTAVLKALRNVIKQAVTTSDGRFIDVDVSFANIAMTGSSINREYQVAMRQYFVRWRAA